MISAVIGRQGFEIIRDRICQILLTEFESQYLKTYDQDLNLAEESIYMERFIAFNQSELPALNVGIERGDYEDYHPGQEGGVYRFFVECNVKAANDADARGDRKAKILAQKLLGISRYILQDPIYRKLSFPPGLIRHCHVESFVFTSPTQHDLENTNSARMIFVVKAVESNELIETALLKSSFTGVKLGESDQGYYWTVDNS